MLLVSRILAGGIGFTLAVTPPGAGAPPTTLAPSVQLTPQVLAVVVNHRNPIETLSSGELRRIFLLETQHWPHGRRITVVHRDPGHAERATALRLICNMTEADYQRHLLHETFRGNTGTARPRAIRTADGMRAFVFNAPGAIGYIWADELDGTVKPLRIDGRLPTEVGYRLLARSAPWLRDPRVAGLVPCTDKSRSPCKA